MIKDLDSKENDNLIVERAINLSLIEIVISDRVFSP